jgi:hypothetical protein
MAGKQEMEDWFGKRQDLHCLPAAEVVKETDDKVQT